MQIFAYFVVFTLIQISQTINIDDYYYEDNPNTPKQKPNSLYDVRSTDIFGNEDQNNLVKEKEDLRKIQLVHNMVQTLTTTGKIKLRNLSINLKTFLAIHQKHHNGQKVHVSSEDKKHERKNDHGKSIHKYNLKRNMQDNYDRKDKIVFNERRLSGNRTFVNKNKNEILKHKNVDASDKLINTQKKLKDRNREFKNRNDKRDREIGQSYDKNRNPSWKDILRYNKVDSDNVNKLSTEPKMELNSSLYNILPKNMWVSTKLKSIDDQLEKEKLDINISNNIDLKKTIEKFNHKFEQKMQDLHLNVVKVFLGSADSKMLALHVVDEYIGILTIVRRDILDAYRDFFTAEDEVLIRHWSYVKDKILSDGEEEKVKLLSHLCDIRVVCKLYPAFSDHMADFIDGIKVFPNDIFSTLFRVIYRLNSSNFLLRLFLSDDEADAAIKGLRTLEDNVEETKHILHVMSIFINNKFKIFAMESKKLNDKVKALRTLIDIIDQAFEEDSNEITFTDLKIGIDNWIGDPTTYKLRKPLNSFMKHLEVILDSSLNDIAKQEIQILTAFAVSGETSEGLDAILREGSRYLQPLAETLSES